MAKEPAENTATEEKPKKRLRQGRLKGMEPKRIEAVETAAEHYFGIMMQRTRLSKKEHTAKDALIDEMLKAGLTKYETDDLVVTATSKSGVEVKKKKEATSDDNGKE